MVKIATLFLIVMVALALFGKLRVPGAKQLSDMRCKKCGRFRIGRGPCPCGRT
jgi:hypothetical protein